MITVSMTETQARMVVRAIHSAREVWYSNGEVDEIPEADYDSLDGVLETLSSEVHKLHPVSDDKRPE